jgi:hypothetical protein
MRKTVSIMKLAQSNSCEDTCLSEFNCVTKIAFHKLNDSSDEGRETLCWVP